MERRTPQNSTNARPIKTAKLPNAPPRSLKPLKALDRAIYMAALAMRWRVVAENAPTGSRINLKAWDECTQASQRAFNNFEIVRIALGYDPDADEPQPRRHWDAGA